MAAESGKNISYRWYAFKHWANLAFLAGAAAAGVVIDPIVWLVAAPLELGALWVVPDLPPFRARVERLQSAKDLARERAYCLDELWGIQPRRNRPQTRLEWIRDLFVEVEDDDIDNRVVTRDPAFEQYTEM